MASRVIAIDGPAGSGKSTTAKAVAQHLKLAHLDSGALYRAVTLVAVDDDLPLDGNSLVEAAKRHEVGFRHIGEEFRTVRAGVDVSLEIRSDRVTQQVSAVAALPDVRDWVNKLLRDAVERHSRGAVADGRDIGTVVFPDAVLKIFLTASIRERARRRALEQADGDAVDIEWLSDALRRRDEADSSRAVAPLVSALDAIQLDTTALTFDEQVVAVIDRARPWFP